jgi:hypothetical protein
MLYVLRALGSALCALISDLSLSSLYFTILCSLLSTICSLLSHCLSLSSIFCSLLFTLSVASSPTVARCPLVHARCWPDLRQKTTHTHSIPGQAVEPQWVDVKVKPRAEGSSKPPQAAYRRQQTSSAAKEDHKRAHQALPRLTLSCSQPPPTLHAIQL